MAVISSFLALATVKPMIDQQYSTSETIVRLLGIFTIAVPPVLPSSLTAISIYALNRLAKHQVFCRSPQKVMVAGRIKTMVFDKTGTLTEEHLQGVLSAEMMEQNGEITKDLSKQTLDSLFGTALSCCHSLVFHQEKGIVGEYMEKEMLGMTGKRVKGAFIEGDHSKFQKLATHPFLAELQRQSVVVKRQDGALFYFVKGSPEKVLALCTAETRKEAAAFISELTSKGNRVLALAGRQLAVGTDST